MYYKAYIEEADRNNGYMVEVELDYPISDYNLIRMIQKQEELSFANICIANLEFDDYFKKFHVRILDAYIKNGHTYHIERIERR